jgi:dTMP kinase
MSGIFITFEGIDFSGKTTQMKRLCHRLKLQFPEREVIQTFEPGATALGARLREEILHKDPICPRAELLLYLADRAEHIDKLIVPALNRGSIVISDRFIDSTIAYQGAGRNFGVEQIMQMIDFTTDGMVPDLTILLDISVEQSRRRLVGRDSDRLEQEQDQFFERVRQCYLELAQTESRIQVFDACDDVDDLSEQIYQAVCDVVG